MAGALGRAVIPGLAVGDMAMPSLILELLPPFWAGVFIAGPLAAIMSTVDSMLLLASAAIIKDLYVQYILKGDSSRMPLQRIKRFSLGCTAAIGAVVFVAALEPPDLLVWINLFAFGGLEATFLWPLLLGLYWRKANAAGALSSHPGGPGLFLCPKRPQAPHVRHPCHRALDPRGPAGLFAGKQAGDVTPSLNHPVTRIQKRKSISTGDAFL